MYTNIDSTYNVKQCYLAAPATQVGIVYYITLYTPGCQDNFIYSSSKQDWTHFPKLLFSYE